MSIGGAGAVDGPSSMASLLTSVQTQLGRAQLSLCSKEWLIEQLLAAALPDVSGGTTVGSGGGFGGSPRALQPPLELTADERAARIAHIKSWKLDIGSLEKLWRRFNAYTHAQLTAEGYLVSPPPQGTCVIPPASRTEKGNFLLQEARDALYALLYGNDLAAGGEGVEDLHRVKRELLTLYLPKAKSARITSLLMADSEVEVVGNWQDPLQVSSDNKARNIMVEVEFGEIAEGFVGHAVESTIKLINLLDINECILYGRISSVEGSTLVD